MSYEEINKSLRKEAFNTVKLNPVLLLVYELMNLKPVEKLKASIALYDMFTDFDSSERVYIPLELQTGLKNRYGYTNIPSDYSDCRLRNPVLMLIHDFMRNTTQAERERITREIEKLRKQYSR